jgi:hypothetical protein
VTPFDLALSVYVGSPTRRTFAEDLAAHLRHGYVYGTPTAFLMGRPVQRDADHRDIVTPEVSFDPATCDCWHIWLAAGDWRSIARRALPYHLPWMSWEREFRLRFHRTEKVLAFTG